MVRVRGVGGVLENVSKGSQRYRRYLEKKVKTNTARQQREKETERERETERE